VNDLEQRPPAIPLSPGGSAVRFVAIVLGAVVVGAMLALLSAPGSGAALAVCAITMPLAFGIGLTAWRSLLGVWLAAVLGRSMLRSRGSEERFREETIRAFGSIREAGIATLPFTWVFVPVGVAVGSVGALALLLVTAGSALPTAMLLALSASAFGVYLRQLARTGRLPLPQE
jgi:hypothetical protein